MANATHPSLGEGTVAGQVVAAEFALRFESEAGTLDLLYDGMTIEFGSRKDPRVTFTSESDSEGTILTSNADITREYSLRRHAGTRAQIEDFEEQQEGKKRLWLTLGFCAGFVLLSALLGALVEWSLPRLINQVPVVWEKDLGKQVAADARKHFRPSGETNVATQLSSLVAQLAKGLPANEYEFRVTLVDVDEPNAFALPGGEIFVNEGLLRLCTNSVEVAGVLAHEISHVTRRHGLRKMITTIGPMKAMQAVLGNRHGLLSTLAAGSEVLIGLSFSRDFEREADEGGFALMEKANFDPRGLEQGLRCLEQFAAGHGGDDGARAFMSHPPTPERIAALEALWKKAAKKDGFATPELLKLEPRKKQNLFDKVDELLKKQQ